jgi:hypothetical protein
MGFYAQVILPVLCDLALDRPFVAKHRRELLANAGGDILEVGFGTGLNLPCYPPAATTAFPTCEPTADRSPFSDS